MEDGLLAPATHIKPPRVVPVHKSQGHRIKCWLVSAYMVRLCSRGFYTDLELRNVKAVFLIMVGFSTYLAKLSPFLQDSHLLLRMSDPILL